VTKSVKSLAGNLDGGQLNPLLLSLKDKGRVNAIPGAQKV